MSEEHLDWMRRSFEQKSSMHLTPNEVRIFWNEITRLRAEVEALKSCERNLCEQLGDQRRRAEAAEAKVERLEKIAEERKNALFRCIERRDAAEARVGRLKDIVRDADYLFGVVEQSAMVHTLYDGRPVEVWCNKARAELADTSPRNDDAETDGGT